MYPVITHPVTLHGSGRDCISLLPSKRNVMPNTAEVFLHPAARVRSRVIIACKHQTIAKPPRVLRSSRARAQIIAVHREILQTGCDLLLSLAVRRGRGLESRLRLHRCCCCSRSSSTWTDVSATLPFCMFTSDVNEGQQRYNQCWVTNYNPLLIPN